MKVNEYSGGRMKERKRRERERPEQGGEERKDVTYRQLQETNK